MSRILPAAVRAIAEQTRRSDKACCVFVRSVLRHAYGPEVIDAVPVARWHLFVQAGIGPWEPVLAAVDAGIGELVEQPRKGWHLVQGWRGTPLGIGVTGHTFFWLGVSQGWGLVLDSTEGRGQRVSGLMTWDEAVSQYHGGVAVAELRRPHAA